MEVDWETDWLDNMMNEAVKEDKHFMNKCSVFANGEYYCTSCVLRC